MNKVAGGRLGRTKAAIAKIRIKTEYRQAERQVKEEEEECKKTELRRKEKVQGKERECRVWDQRSAQELTSEEHGDNETMVEGSKQTEMNTPVNIKRRLPIVPPTPFEETLPLSQMLLNQQDLTIVNTPTERRKLPKTPLERVRRMSSLPSWSEQGFNNASKNLPSRSQLRNTTHTTGKGLPSVSEPECTISKSLSSWSEHNSFRIITGKTN